MPFSFNAKLLVGVDGRHSQLTAKRIKNKSWDDIHYLSLNVW